jgi:hypothetical protein
MLSGLERNRRMVLALLHFVSRSERLKELLQIESFKKKVDPTPRNSANHILSARALLLLRKIAPFVGHIRQSYLPPAHP